MRTANCVENYDSIYEFASDPGYIDEPVIRVEPAASETLYYHRNQQYSVTALTSSTGGVVERYAYSAYGEPKFLSGTGTVLTDSVKDNRYTYTGREWDKSIGLYHYRARMYDAESGRFCGRDPIGFIDSFNLAEFIGGSPLAAVDPSGNRRFDVRSQHCRTVLYATISGWRLLGMNCAADLMAAFLSGRGDPCPQSCRETLEREGFGYLTYCLRNRLMFEASCGQKSRSTFNLTGKHYFEASPADDFTSAGELGLALGHFSWSAKGSCESDCGATNKSCCCNCTATCGWEIKVGPDTYDFAKDKWFPHPAWCAWYLQEQGDAKAFKVECNLTIHAKSIKQFQRCPGPGLPPNMPCTPTRESINNPIGPDPDVK